jgi:cyclopropane fatty-acyl-phospholipid synthase-like methyltransferase
MSNWDDHWPTVKKDSFGTRLYHRLVFNAYKKLLDGKLIKPDIFEIGCGTGELSARLVERYGGSVTVLDSSNEALKIAEGNFKGHKIQAKIIKSDIFDFSSDKKYDFVHSEGLIEHFIGDKQKDMVMRHKALAREGGYVLISVPRFTWYYRLWRGWKEKRGDWHFGYEMPMTPEELRKVMESAGLEVLNMLKAGRFSFALAKA